MNQELILDFTDLRWIDIQCAQCGMHTVLDVADDRTHIPGHCPGCQLAYESVGLRDPLIYFMRAYRNLTALKQKISVRVPIDSKTPV